MKIIQMFYKSVYQEGNYGAKTGTAVYPVEDWQLLDQKPYCADLYGWNEPIRLDGGEPL